MKQIKNKPCTCGICKKIIFTKKEKKVQISATIDESNFNLINEILEKNNLQFSTALNDILTYFVSEWEAGRIVMDEKEEESNEFT